MREKRRGSLLSLGLAAALACGMVPAAALAEPPAKITETPPHRGVGASSRRCRDRRNRPS